MSGVSVDKDVTLYTWDDCVFGWDSIECQKAWDDFGRINYTVLLGEHLRMSDSQRMSFGKDLNERLVVADCVRANVTKVLRENLCLYDDLITKTDFSRVFSEKICLRDELCKRYVKEFDESLNVGELLGNSINKLLNERMQIGEDLSRQVVFTRVWVENIRLQDSMTVRFDKLLSDGIGLVEGKGFEVTKNLSEKLRVIDNFSRTVHYVREFIEQLCMKEQLTKKYGLNVKDALCVSTALIRNCNAVLSNILLSGEELSEQGFIARVNTAPGYNAFQDFSVGEYEFQKALVRIIISNAQTQSEPLIYDVNHHVDIDDVVDGGVVNITDVSAPTKVRYKKFYYNHPEVSVILKGGNTGQVLVVPRLLRTDGDDGHGKFFEVELVNSSNVRVAGTISWTSRGY